MEGNTQEAQQGKISPIPLFGKNELSPDKDSNPKDDHPHRKTQPDHHIGTGIAEGHLGCNERGSPNNNRKERFKDCTSCDLFPWFESLPQRKTIDVKCEKASAPSAENASRSTPKEITTMILYLVSDEAGPINGAKIPYELITIYHHPG